MASDLPEPKWIPLLLADPSPCLRWLVLRRLLGRSDDDEEVRELAALRLADPLLTDLLDRQKADGSWPRSESVGAGGAIQRTAQALMRLGYLGFGPDYPPVARAAGYLFDLQQDDGHWPLVIDGESSGKYSNYDRIPLQTALPLRGLASCGYAADERSERAYEWLFSTRLSDGAWPTGYVSGSYGFVAGYRRLPHSRWGCRANTTGALMCLALHPERRRSPEAARGLDMLLGRETGETRTVGYDVARTLGFEEARGFFTYYGAFDLAMILYLCSRIGASLEDERVARILSAVGDLQGEYGLWQYVERPAASRWVTFELLRIVAAISDKVDWIPLEPRTPFTPYPKQDRRY